MSGKKRGKDREKEQLWREKKNISMDIMIRTI
jgi:hypothetical protein